MPRGVESVEEKLRHEVIVGVPKNWLRETWRSVKRVALTSVVQLREWLA